MQRKEELSIREKKEEKEGRERAYRDLMQGGEEDGGKSNAEGWDEEDFM